MFALDDLRAGHAPPLPAFVKTAAMEATA
jgi:hypothetical protein